MKTIKFGKYQGVVEDEIFEQEVFDMDTDSGDLIQITRPVSDSRKLIITNGMNGWGENIFEEIKDLEVEVIDGPFSEKVGESLEPLLEGEEVTDNNQADLAESLYQSESPAETLDQDEKAEREGEYIYFRMTADSATEKVFISGPQRTDEQINNDFEEKCGGVYEWIRASDITEENHGGEFEDGTN